MRVCIEAGCGDLTSGTRCTLHESRRQQRRGSPTARGLGYRYQQARLRVLARDGYTCHWCGKAATTADHLIPRARGGSDRDDNLAACCTRCNSSRGANVRR